MTRPLGTGQLFTESARSAFLRISGQRYDSMRVRLEHKKNGPTLPFTKDQFREWLLAQMGGKPDGFVSCRYCKSYVGLSEIGIDHAISLAQGGSSGLDNLELPCKRCNARKGKLPPEDYLKLLHFLETELPFSRLDVLERLEKAVQLAAGQRFNAGVMGDLKKSGQWQAARDARRKKRE